jgi:hypothetical protein
MSRQKQMSYINDWRVSRIPWMRYRTETSTFLGKTILCKYRRWCCAFTLRDQRRLSYGVLGQLVHGPLAQCSVHFPSHQVDGQREYPVAVEPWEAKEVESFPYKSIAEGNEQSARRCCHCPSWMAFPFPLRPKAKV